MATPLIAVRDLRAPLPPAPAPVLRGLSFAVHAGERVVLTGPSGSGKSTLLRCMVCLEPADGAVLMDGKEVAPERVRELRRRVGYLPQKPVSVGPTIDDNLAFPSRVSSAAIDASGQDALMARLGLGELDRRRRFETLSGGEQQRVALVRSLSAAPDVLLLDEPTASLDPENVADVVALLRAWADDDSGRALVWVSHHLEQATPLATRRVAMAELRS